MKIKKQIKKFKKLEKRLLASLPEDSTAPESSNESINADLLAKRKKVLNRILAYARTR